MGSWADKSPVTGASGSTRILTRPGSGSPRSHTIPRQHPHPHPHPHASACTRPRPRSASEPVKVQDRQVAGRPLAAGGARGRASGQVPPADRGPPGPILPLPRLHATTRAGRLRPPLASSTGSPRRRPHPGCGPAGRHRRRRLRGGACGDFV